MILSPPHTHPFTGPLSRTIQVSQKGKTNLDFTEATDSEWQWHQLGHVQVCTLLQQRQSTEGISSPQKSRKKLQNLSTCYLS